MAVYGSLIGEFTVLVAGMDTRALTLPQWAQALGVMGRHLQTRVARSFAGQKTKGSVWLGKNSAKYTAQKAKQGLDIRRGHRTNNLQRVLDTGRLFMVRITPQGNGTLSARVVMEEQMLHSMVPYSEYYEEKKVRSAGILALAASWVREEIAMLRKRELASLAKMMRQNSRSAAQVVRSVSKPLRAGNIGQQIVRTNIDARRARALRILGGK